MGINMIVHVECFLHVPVIMLFEMHLKLFSFNLLYNYMYLKLLFLNIRIIILVTIKYTPTQETITRNLLRQTYIKMDQVTEYAYKDRSELSVTD